jgi:lipopolysaccharide transport system ATP-binding protein
MPGQSIGIVGRNGAGKSTLLKLIARIITPTSGQLSTNGRISALLELGAGFHPDLTGRENIFLNGSVLGLSKQDIQDSYQAIVDSCPGCQLSGHRRFLRARGLHRCGGQTLFFRHVHAAGLQRRHSRAA